MRLRVVVTGGGTVESIDDVRLSRSLEIETLAGIETSILHTEISNLSKGGFAKSIAKSFCGLRFESVKLEVVLIACHNLYQELSREDLPANLQLVPFTAFADLKEALEKELAKDRTDIVVMAAAVSDYSPMKVQGKISSDSEFFDVRMRRNPKLLESLRDMCGSGSTIAGFKLTSRLPEDQIGRAHV